MCINYGQSKTPWRSFQGGICWIWPPLQHHSKKTSRGSRDQLEDRNNSTSWLTGTGTPSDRQIQETHEEEEDANEGWAQTPRISLHHSLKTKLIETKPELVIVGTLKKQTETVFVSFLKFWFEWILFDVESVQLLSCWHADFNRHLCNMTSTEDHVRSFFECFQHKSRPRDAFHP